MPGQSAKAPVASCKTLLIPLLFLSIFRLMQSSDEMGLDAPLNGLRIDLVHTDSLLSPNITSTERLKRAVQRSRERLEKLKMSLVNADKSVDEERKMVTPVSAGNGEFLMKMAIGTPALSFSAILDTGSDLIWTQCKPCTDCYQQPTPIYDPSLSSTYSKVPCKSSLCLALPSFSCTRAKCEYLYVYGDSSFTNGILSYETFTLSSQAAPRIAFGCGKKNGGSGFSEGGGLVGFGRGPLSFVSQLGKSMGNMFSYCLVSVADSPSKTSPLFIGQTASLKANTVNSTPILQSSSQPTFYYLTLEGISVGGQLLDIPAGTFDLQYDGTGGIVIDSGTTVTYLEQNAYNVVKKAIRSSIKLRQVDGSSIGLDLCYKQQSGSSTTNFPTITFHFKGANYELAKENYMFVDSSGILCLAMMPSIGMSIFGNFQQQNYHILYDNGRNMLSFAPTVCDAM